MDTTTILIVLVFSIIAHEIGHWIAAKAFHVQEYKWGLRLKLGLKDLHPFRRLAYCLSGVILNLVISYVSLFSVVAHRTADDERITICNKVDRTNFWFMSNVYDTCLLLTEVVGLELSDHLPRKHTPAPMTAEEVERVKTEKRIFIISYINMLLAIVNLIPILPLDGGQAVCCLLTKSKNDLFSAPKTQMAQ